MKLLQPAVGLMLATSLVYAAQNITVFYNSTSIAYSGANAWSTLPSCGGAEITDQANMNFIFNFVGTAVYVFGTAGINGGISLFNVDGVSAEYDRYATTFNCDRVMFSSGVLTNGSHTLSGTFTGKTSPENSTSTHPFTEYQYIIYTQLDSTDATSSVSPTSSSTSDTTLISTSTIASVSTTATDLDEPDQTAGIDKGSKVKAAAMGGGIAVGVIALLAIIGLTVWLCIRRNKRATAGEANANRPDIDPPQQTYAYSPVEVSEYGRPSYEGAAGRPAPGKHRSSMSAALSDTSSTPWIPDPQLAARFASYSDSPTVPVTPAFYLPGAAAPSGLQSSLQQSASSPVHAPVQRQSMMGMGSLPESDVERIAARLATLIQPGQQQQQQQSPPGAMASSKDGASSSPNMHHPSADDVDLHQPPPRYEL